MSKPSPGNYFIVNRVTSLSGKPLAMNFDGENAVVTVVELENMPTQVWVVSDYSDGKTQSVSPQVASDLQIGMEGSILKVLQPNGYVWTIRDLEGVYTVQDGRLTGFWGLKKATNQEPVSFDVGTGDEKQNWILIPA